MSERLTIRLANGGVMYDNGEYYAVCYPWNKHCLRSVDRTAIKLCELEDKIEQGNVVEVRHGEWRDRYDEKYANRLYECSLCGEIAPEGTVYDELERPLRQQILSPYCPNCGAKMDVENSENKIN